MFVVSSHILAGRKRCDPGWSVLRSLTLDLVSPILSERVKTTEEEVRSCTEGEEDEEDGAETQVSHGAAVGTGAGALHPDVQGLLKAEALVLDDGGGQVGITLVMDHRQRLPGIS